MSVLTLEPSKVTTDDFIPPFVWDDDFDDGRNDNNSYLVLVGLEPNKTTEPDQADLEEILNYLEQKRVEVTPAMQTELHYRVNELNGDPYHMHNPTLVWGENIHQLSDGSYSMEDVLYFKILQGDVIGAAHFSKLLFVRQE